MRARILVAGQVIQHDDKKSACPALFLDPELRVICIGDHLIPLDGGTVDYFIRARAAIAPRAVIR